MLPSVEAMLLQHGLAEGKDYKIVLLDGFDPKVHIATPDIVGFAGYQSNEPLQLQARAGIDVRHVQPVRRGHPRQLRRHLHQRRRSSTPTRRRPRTSCGRRCGARRRDRRSGRGDRRGRQADQRQRQPAVTLARQRDGPLAVESKIVAEAATSVVPDRRPRPGAAGEGDRRRTARSACSTGSPRTTARRSTRRWSRGCTTPRHDHLAGGDGACLRDRRSSP